MGFALSNADVYAGSISYREGAKGAEGVEGVEGAEGVESASIAQLARRGKPWA